MGREGPRGRQVMRSPHYKPISAYGAIGNLRTCMLVGLDGAIDWGCFPDIDCPSVYAALLDHQRGGRFRLWGRGAEEANQWYIEDTNVLNTQFKGARASLSITDFMPLWGRIDGKGGSEAPPEVHRLVKCQEGNVELEMEWAPRFDYAQVSTELTKVDGGWLAMGGGSKMSLGGLDDGEPFETEFGPILRSRLDLSEGDELVLVNRWATEDTRCSRERSRDLLARTVEVWSDWAHGEEATHEWTWAGKWLPQLIRSELVLKLMTNADTGAIVAAPTTSLPETLGGVRNWDYRFSWIRDSALTAQALISLGHQREAVEFLHWVEEAAMMNSTAKWGPQIMYGVHGEADLEERELPHLEGYLSSRPVRIGNEAASQVQLEIYGELLNTGWELLRRGIRLETKIMDFLSGVASTASNVWQEPDRGIWEIRGEPVHFTYSKVMLWVAVDRAVHMSEQYDLRGNVDQWKSSREAIAQSVLENGYDHEVGAFVQSYGSRELDAANLRIPLLEFLPFEDTMVQSTIDRTIEQLTENGLVYRYLEDDPSWGKEGAFGLCTFWLVDALALSGRLEEAWDIFNNMARRTNHLGLLSEQIDPSTGEFLGNFPQAFTHIGLINSALYLAYAEGRSIPKPPPMGTKEHRAQLGSVHVIGH